MHITMYNNTSNIFLPAHTYFTFHSISYSNFILRCISMYNLQHILSHSYTLNDILVSKPVSKPKMSHSWLWHFSFKTGFETKNVTLWYIGCRNTWWHILVRRHTNVTSASLAYTHQVLRYKWGRTWGRCLTNAVSANTLALELLICTRTCWHTLK